MDWEGSRVLKYSVTLWWRNLEEIPLARPVVPKLKRTSESPAGRLNYRSLGPAPRASGVRPDSLDF